MKLLLVRHGRTRFNTEKRFLGQVDDPLDALGIKQAEALAERLSAERIRAVISSDLLRASTTAYKIAQRHDLSVHLDADLREINMGVWEGRKQQDVRREEATLFAQWLQNPTLYYPKGGESLEDMRGRIRHALSHYQSRYPTLASEEEPTLVWVTHTAYLGVLICDLLGLPLSARRHFYADNASVTQFHFVSTKSQGVQPVLLVFNDTAHLQAQGLIQPSHSYLYLPD